ncbi:hypothetical protein LPB248_15375 [Flavobacterium sp. LPB0248]|uniref:hypothetical protein n=1 Tax=Flavobacterium sp. LPB0248 TaxID=2614441 RepID=UPI0015A71F7B|nr:hypothetical protein [Flavobacterium sp. LPB0248]QLC67635.1 hypothetical protein LPB248_15375 [Flavobacterium sp. LPB0248]
MKKKINLYRILPLFIIISAVTVFLIYNNQWNKKFIKLEANSIIVTRNNWQLRTTEFYLQNGLRIDSTFKDNFDLKIGDSISKKSNTNTFSVYRKENGIYTFYKKNAID